MFSSKIVLEKEIKEKERLQRRKMYEEERRKRVLNPKGRMIGIDEKMLKKQLEEKKLLKDFEKAIEDRYYKNQMYAIAEADRLENEILEAKKRINQEINLFRKVYQRKSHAPGDQQDGNKYQKEPGLSSGLIFDGEDLGAKNRKQMQTQQQKYWLLQQIAEKNQITNEKLFAEKIHGDCLKAREIRALALENLEKECRKLSQITVKEYNEAFARNRTSKKSLDSRKEREDNETEIRNAMTSDLLTENTEVSQSNLGPGRIIQYHYKGMSPQEQLDVRRAQMEQIKERQVMNAAENSYNRKWDHFYKEMDHLLLTNDELRKNEERRICKANMDKNRLLSLNTKAQNLQRKREEASNYSTPEFLNQFNKTSR